MFAPQDVAVAVGGLCKSGSRGRELIEKRKSDMGVGNKGLMLVFYMYILCVPSFCCLHSYGVLVFWFSSSKLMSKAEPPRDDGR